MCNASYSCQMLINLGFFLQFFSKIFDYKIPPPKKFRPVGDEFFDAYRQTDRQTDRHLTKLTVAFYQFYEAT